MLWRWPNKLRFKSKSRWWPKPWSALNSLAVNQYVIPWRANIDPKQTPKEKRPKKAVDKSLLKLLEDPSKPLRSLLVV